MEYRDKVIEIVQRKGPLLPVDVYKEIGLNVLMTSAVLSELVSGEKLKLTSLKIGGSPLYYLPGQEAKLEQFSSRLKGPEKEAFELLKKNKVVSDKDLQPAVRVAIKDIKDYAKQVKYNDDYFWKWFLLSDEETETEIKKKLGEIGEEKKEEKPRVQEKKAEAKIEEKKQEQKPEEEEPEIFKQYKAKSVKKEEKSEEKKPDLVEEKKIEEKKIEVQEETKPKEIKKIDLGDKFLGQVKDYFENNKIDIIDCTIVKKNSEMDLVIKMPTPMGKIAYYCKAKNKKKCNDGDLSSAYVKGEMKKLPVIFLTTGELTKKTQELLLTDFKNITLTKI
jgi:hypothetical protein